MCLGGWELRSKCTPKLWPWFFTLNTPPNHPSLLMPTPSVKIFQQQQQSTVPCLPLRSKLEYLARTGHFSPLQMSPTFRYSGVIWLRSSPEDTDRRILIRNSVINLFMGPVNSIYYWVDRRSWLLIPYQKYNEQTPAVLWCPSFPKFICTNIGVYRSFGLVLNEDTW